MKKLLLSLMFAMSVGVASAQTDAAVYGAGKMPFTATGEVVFSRVVRLDSCSADQIYRAAKLYVAEAFKSAKDVTQIDDSESKMMIIKGWREQKPTSSFMSAFAGAPFQVFFTAKIQARDGRCKIDVYQLRGHQRSHITNGARMPEQNHPAEVLTDAQCIRSNGDLKTAGYGFWRRIVMDAALSTLIEAEAGIERNTKQVAPASEDW